MNIFLNKKFALIALVIILSGLFFVTATPPANAKDWTSKPSDTSKCRENSSANLSFSSLINPFLIFAEKTIKGFGYNVVLATSPDPDFCGAYEGTLPNTRGDNVICSGGTAEATISWVAAPTPINIPYAELCGPFTGDSELNPLEYYILDVNGTKYNTGKNNSLTISGLANNTNYNWSVNAFYRIGSFDGTSFEGTICSTSLLEYTDRPSGSFDTSNCSSPPPPPPPPPLSPPSTPTGFDGSCPIPGLSGQVTWNAVSNATYYVVRLDDKIDGLTSFSGIANFGVGGDLPFVGDWNGDGISREIGTMRDDQWYFDSNGNGAWDGCGVDGCSGQFGNSAAPLNDQPIIGAWNGGVVDKIGVFRPGGAQFILDNGDRNWNASDDTVINFSITPDPNDKGVAGDWSGDGSTGIGIFRNGQWYLDDNNDGITDLNGSFGQAGDLPIVGDWKDDGIVSGPAQIGVFRPDTGEWFLDNGNRTWDGCGAGNDTCYDANSFGYGTDLPVVGRWEETGTNDRIGVFRDIAWFVDINGNGTWDEFQSTTGTFFNFTTIPGHEYVVWLHACNANGCSNGASKGFICSIQYMLSVYREGSGYGSAKFSPPENIFSLPRSITYNSGTLVTLIPYAASDSTFSGWGTTCAEAGGTISDNECRNIRMNAAKNVTANFTLLAAPVNGACGSANGSSFSTAPTTNLCNAGTASAVSGSGPWAWSCIGSGGGTDASCSANLAGGGDCTLSIVTIGTGTVSGSAGSDIITNVTAYSEDVGCDSSVNITAYPAPGQKFIEWSGQACDKSTLVNCSFNMDGSSKSVAAEFKRRGFNWREILPW